MGAEQPLPVAVESPASALQSRGAPQAPTGTTTAAPTTTTAAPAATTTNR
jgi:hypothetical protein